MRGKLPLLEQGQPFKVCGDRNWGENTLNNANEASSKAEDEER